MSLIDEHEEVLATSLENDDLFGVPITFIANDDSEFTLYGQANIISRHIAIDTGYQVTAERSNVTVRMSSLRTQLSFTDTEDLRVKLKDFRIRTSPQPSKIPEVTQVIEGGIFPDSHLGIVTVFLKDVEVVI